jgi:hypothetical protein
LLIQFLITVIAIADGIAATGMEDAPVWGLAALTTWGSAVSITPLLAILFDITIQIRSRSNPKDERSLTKR